MIGYAQLDPAKKRALALGVPLDELILRHGCQVEPWCRGESVMVIRVGGLLCIAHTEETLGTKTLAADLAYQAGLNHYRGVGTSAAAVILNDLATCGAQPIHLAMHWAVGDSAYLADEPRVEGIFQGWADACQKVGCTWGQGEMHNLKPMIAPNTSVLSGSAVGISRPVERIIVPSVQAGAHIVFLASSGPHDNGISKIRAIAEQVEGGYAAQIAPGVTLADALFAPTTLYGPVVQACMDANLRIQYVVNITGHGFAKLMRFPEPFVYMVDKLPEPTPIFDFIQHHYEREGDSWKAASPREMHKSYNMGAGYALVVHPDDSDKVVEQSLKLGIHAWVGGEVEKRGDNKLVVLKEYAITFNASDLDLR